MANLWYNFAVRVLRVGFKVLYRHKSIGKKDAYLGGAIVAPNHVSHLDPIAVGISWPNDLHYFARDTLFDTPRLARLLRSVQVHPIARGEADVTSMKKIIQLLKEGKQVVLFPEGTRSPDGQLQTGEAGVAMLAVRAGVPIVPVYVEGTYDVWSRHRKRPKLFGRTRTLIGKPIFPKDFEHLGKHEQRQALINATMAALREMQKTGDVA